MSIKVATFATDPKDHLKNWKTSAYELNYNYTIMGLGKKWHGWPQRTKAYLDFVSKQEPNQIVVLCDAYDLLFIEQACTLRNKFLSFNKNIIVSAEPRCCTGKMNNKNNFTKFTKFCKEQAPKGQSFIYPCAGCVIGYAGALKNLYTKIRDSEFDTDDQSALDRIWEQDPNIITLDYDSLIVGNVYISDINKEWQFDNNGFLRRKNNYPSVLHFPGSNGFNANYSVYNNIGKKLGKHFIPLESRMLNASGQSKFFVWFAIVCVAIIIALLIYWWIKTSREKRKPKA